MATLKQCRDVANELKKYHATAEVDIVTNDHMADALAYGFQQVIGDKLGGVWHLHRSPKCMHSNFPGNSKQRRQMRRWHRKNNPTCNDSLMENLRLGRTCPG